MSVFTRGSPPSAGLLGLGRGQISMAPARDLLNHTHKQANNPHAAAGVIKTHRNTTPCRRTPECKANALVKHAAPFPTLKLQKVLTGDQCWGRWSPGSAWETTWRPTPARTEPKSHSKLHDPFQGWKHSRTAGALTNRRGLSKAPIFLVCGRGHKDP